MIYYQSGSKEYNFQYELSNAFKTGNGDPERLNERGLD